MEQALGLWVLLSINLRAVVPAQAGTQNHQNTHMNHVREKESMTSAEAITLLRPGVTDEPAPQPIFEQAARRREALALPYAGAVTPLEAWALVQWGAAVLVDVRTAAELKYVGRVPGAVHIEWSGGDPTRRAAFARALCAAVPADTPTVLLCRSAVRSHHAAAAAHEQGLSAVYNILEGFEGKIDERQQRGHLNGWRKHGLPWVQD